MSASPSQLAFTLSKRASAHATFPITYFLLLLTLIAATETTKAQSFSAPLTYSVGDNPNSGTSGDFNGDSKPDLAVANVLNKNVSILLNKGDGTFDNAVNYGVDFNPESLATGDFDNDGKLDLAVGNFLGGATSAGNISMLLGNGNGTFKTAVNYDASSPISLQATDLNGDGKLDLVAASWNTNTTSVLLGTGNGTFQAVTVYPAGTQPRGISVADFNGDGKPDLAVTNILSNNISILLGNGNGTFQTSINTPTPSGPIGIAASDFNGDSKQDLVVAAASSNTVLVLVGIGDGTFQTPVSYAVGAEPQRLELADFNGDGRKDLVVVNANAASVSVLRGNSDGTFQSTITHPSRSGSFSPVVSDFDTDGKPDLAILSNSFDVVDVLLNSPSAHSVAIIATAAAPTTDVLVATFKDYDSSKTAVSFTASVNWGDGTTATSGAIASNGTGGFNVTGTHTYAKEGMYSVNVRIADSGGNLTSIRSTATVADAPLTATGKTLNAIAGLSFTTLVAHFTDADPTGNVGEFSSTVAWGDGASSPGAITADGGGGFNVSGSHTYNSAGSFSIAVMIRDVGGSTITANSTANVSIPIQFNLSNYSVNESVGSALIIVVRVGGSSGTATVDYATNDFMAARCDAVPANASAKCDYTTAGGTLSFAAGESSKTMVLSIIDDAFVEGNETLTISLSKPTGAGVVLGSSSSATITIVDNDTDPNAANPYLNNAFFVRQQYLDFLLREPDTAGFTDWNNVLNGCGPQQGGLGAPAGCDRVHVSSGFFRSPEFGEKGYWVYRFFEGSLGRRPQFAESMPEMRRLSGLATDAEQEAKRADFIARFMQLPEFTNIYTGLTDSAHASQFIAKLEEKARVTLPETVPPTQPGQPTQYGRSQLIGLMQAGTLTPAQTLGAFTEQKVVWDTYFYRAFVAMQYFGYLRRDPEPAGYDDWVDVLTNGRASAGVLPGDYRHLIFGFVYSIEYRERFGKQ
jgi:Calx-beta domain-containing protein/VCBS repeat protein